MYYKTELDSPLGRLTMVSDGSSIVGLWMEGQKQFHPEKWMHAAQGDNLPVMQLGIKWLECYFSGSTSLPQLPPLAPAGTDFQMEVWQILLQIPYGQTVTYGQISNILAERRLDRGMSAQAVGTAVGKNPISIMIPCHRVVGTGINPGGYDGGLERKHILLRIERGTL